MRRTAPKRQANEAQASSQHPRRTQFWGGMRGPGISVIVPAISVIVPGISVIVSGTKFQDSAVSGTIFQDLAVSGTIFQDLAVSGTIFHDCLHPKANPARNHMCWPAVALHAHKSQETILLFCPMRTIEVLMRLHAPAVQAMTTTWESGS